MPKNKNEFSGYCAPLYEVSEMKQSESEQALHFIQNMLLQNYFSKNIDLLIETRLFNCKNSAGFDTKGCARIEVLYDLKDEKDDGNTITLHGLTENIDQQRMSMTLFCEIKWLNRNLPEKRFSEVCRDTIKSLVMDFTQEQQYLSSAVFVMSLKSVSSGEDVGHGLGYLLFEHARAL